MIIPKKTKAYTYIEWLCKALGKPGNSCMDKIFVEYDPDTTEVTLVACDSYRLHKVVTKEFHLETGLYIASKAKEGYVLTKSEDNITNYPDWKRLMPDLSTRFKSKFTFSPLQVSVAISQLVYIYTRIINEKFLSDALSIHQDWDIYAPISPTPKAGTHCSFIFTKKEFYCLLMPITFLTELVEEDKQRYLDFIESNKEKEKNNN